MVAVVTAIVKGPGSCLVKNPYYYAWCQLWFCCGGRGPEGAPSLSSSDRDNRWPNEAWVCRLQTAFANLFPDSSKFSFTGYFLEYFIKFLCDLRAVFHGGGPVYTQQNLFHLTSEGVTVERARNKYGATVEAAWSMLRLLHYLTSQRFPVLTWSWPHCPDVCSCHCVDSYQALSDFRTTSWS